MARKELDYTMVNTFCTCPRKYEYRINRGLVPKKRATPLEFGGAIHKALDEWYQSRDEQKALELFTGTYQEDESDAKRTHKMGKWILQNYFSSYRDQPWKPILSEKAFTVPAPGHPEYSFIGRIDKIVEWDKVLWVVDHKTTSGLGPQYTKKVEPNGQLAGYKWAAKEMGYEVAGVILDVLLVAKGLLDSSSRSRLQPLLRIDAYISDDRLYEWASEFSHAITRIKGCEAKKVWPMEGMFNGACTYYGECPYQKVCMEDGDVRERVLGHYYEEDFWDPRNE